MKVKTLLLIELLGTLLIPVVAMAQSDFDGTWKVDISKTSISGNPAVFLLQKGTYQCKSCIPIVTAKADGEDHTVTGNPYYDTISVKILDDRTLEEIRKKNGKTVATSKVVVSPDGAIATFEFTDSSNTNADPVIAKGSLIRVAKSKHPTGTHIISGSWRVSKYANLSDNALIFSFKVERDSLKMTTETGQSYAANFGGAEAPYKGDYGVNSVSLERLGKDTFVETDKRDGKAIRVRRIMVNPNDEKTMNIIVDDNLSGVTTLLTADKQ